MLQVVAITQTGVQLAIPIAKATLPALAHRARVEDSYVNRKQREL